MTRAEAAAANVVIRWTFNRSGKSWDPVAFQDALETLAAGAYRRLGSGIDRATVREWAARH
jgi:hypothetical protein